MRRVAVIVLNLGATVGGQLETGFGHFTTDKEIRFPNVQEVGRGPGPVWTFAEDKTSCP
jgi:hypothetical protein